MSREKWVIHWNEYNSDTYMYGSMISYGPGHEVHYKNMLMPPGTVIKEWYSKTNYQAQRIEPALPLIDGESRYVIKINIDTPQRRGCLVRLVFLDRYEREVGDLNIKDDECEFACPIKTYAYKMQIINAGMTEFVFHSVVIEEIEDDEENIKGVKKDSKRSTKSKKV